jgi:hypothetical protein
VYVAQLHFTQTLTAKIAGELGVSFPKGIKKLMLLRYIYALILSMLSLTIKAEEISEYRISGTEIVTISSGINKQDYELYIKLPRNYSQTKKIIPLQF